MQTDPFFRGNKQEIQKRQRLFHAPDAEFPFAAFSAHIPPFVGKKDSERGKMFPKRRSRKGKTCRECVSGMGRNSVRQGLERMYSNVALTISSERDNLLFFA